MILRPSHSPQRSFASVETAESHSGYSESPGDFSGDDKADLIASKLTHSERDRSNFNVAVGVSPSGTQMVYISDRSMYNNVYLASALDGKLFKKLISGGEARNRARSIFLVPAGREALQPRLAPGIGRARVLVVERVEALHAQSGL